MARAVPALLRRAARRRTVALPSTSSRRSVSHRPNRAPSSRRGWASTRCGRCSTGKFEEPGHLDQLGRRRAPWALAFPAAIGAKSDVPIARSGAIDGDGCFQMTAQELVTVTRWRGIPIKVADPQQRLPRHGAPVAGDVLRRALLGRSISRRDLPDYVKWAEAMGCVGLRVDTT